MQDTLQYPPREIGYELSGNSDHGEKDKFKGYYGRGKG